MSSAARICLSLTVSALVLFVGPSARAQTQGTSLDLAVDQRGPAALRGYLANAGSYLYDTARVQNVSRRSITGLVFGVLLVEPANPAIRQLLRSSTVQVSIAPGDTHEHVKVGLLTPSELQEFERGSATPKVILGILAVEWEDGRQWRFELDEYATDFKTGVSQIRRRMEGIPRW